MGSHRVHAFFTNLAPTCGRLADIFGRKKIYVYGLVIFTIASLLCGLVADIYQLIGFRVLQSIGGAIMVANGTIIVADAFPVMNWEKQWVYSL
ncbi:hypothetical protein DLD82_17815 [Methanospirillum stamsii]|uniref:Major facilitator superfamily (MFS) profile domain-containing protein n=1 Tax=Methanospirillum stamsii TaxID=1277351 RepID=A0A2V2N042_9EURY|nr:MFS transporter [Methanospirillum stamsii]PWR69527.1 hypothetical protein DLD82_17815 [Methanospirillum stamsii]